MPTIKHLPDAFTINWIFDSGILTKGGSLDSHLGRRCYQIERAVLSGDNPVGVIEGQPSGFHRLQAWQRDLQQLVTIVSDGGMGVRPINL